MRPPSLPLPAFAAAAVLVSAALASDAGVEKCLSLPQGGDPLACVLAEIGDRPPSEADCVALDPLIEADPAAALRLFEGLATRVAATDRARLPPMLDRQATALRALGRRAEAAERQLQAFELDAGTVWVRTRSPTGDVRLVEIDPGRRLGATLIRLAEANRSEEAAPLVERARRLGLSELDLGVEAPEWETLVAGPWHEPLPELPIRLLGGGTFHTNQARGHVLILDFWASWCKPCLEELPSLRELYEAERARGLEAVAVNVGETVEVVESFAGKHRLGMPIGFFDEAIAQAFDPSTLPTVIIADARGGIRARFDGYKEGLTNTIAGIVRALLDGTPERTTEVARVDVGRGSFELAWMRTAPGEIEGLAAVRPKIDGPLRMAVAAGHEIALYDLRGAVTDFWKRPTGSGTLRSADLEGDGRDELFTFRRGGTRVTRTAPGQEPVAFEAPGPLLDLEIVPAAGEARAELWLATLERLYRSQVDGRAATAIEGTSAVIEVERVGAGRAAVLASQGRCFVDLASRAPPECAPLDGASGLVSAAGDGLLFELSTGVVAAVYGSFTRAGAKELAAATRSGRVVLFDVASGETAWRAAWPGVSALAAADLDGDGTDELIVGAGNRLSLLD